uniref:Uncharacterized protein n=1 Tax=Arundo donax TaxID=35708 RepID=A0A0A9HH21_ARUDO
MPAGVRSEALGAAPLCRPTSVANASTASRSTTGLRVA